MATTTVVVTGDIVLDCHLYGSAKSMAASSGQQGTVYSAHLGGSVLTHKLLCEAARQAAEQAAAGAARRAGKGAALKCVATMNYESYLALDTTGLEESLPAQLRSYGVWTDQPTQTGQEGLVWRADHHFGYGPDDARKPAFALARNPAALPAAPDLTVIDDGAITFRRADSQNVWPAFSKDAAGEYLMKMSWPLCRGDLWDALTPVRDRLTVVVAAADLRREDAQINARLSWEQSADHTIIALQNDPLLRELLKAAQVIVSFRSAGALWFVRRPNSTPVFRLVFDSTMLEGDHSRRIKGTTYGFQTCLTVGIAHHLMEHRARSAALPAASPAGALSAEERAVLQGISAGLLARRCSLELGHGKVGDRTRRPGFPLEEIARTIVKPPGKFVSIEVPGSAWRPGGCRWTILEQSEISDVATGPVPGPLTGLAHLTARYGEAALSHVPALRLGRLFTVDRTEIESYRTLDGLIRAYEETKVQKKPLSIGVFGPPGAGKSFGVEVLSKSILGDNAPFLEFNLSQFKDPEELIGAFHRVRDAVLKGITPVAFWDEFDSQQYKWLQYLLAPMQDGAFQQGEITHPIGKCIFIFAGGTSPTLDTFGIAPPRKPTEQEQAQVEPAERRSHLEEYQAHSERYREFVLLKGPDFVSRLHGFLNVLGPNRCEGGPCIDITWPIRRALILRGILGCRPSEELAIDHGLLRALLGVSQYRHGARSFEKILRTLMLDRTHGRLHRSALPPRPLLDRETDADEFHRLLVEGDTFKNHPDLETLAAAVHYHYLQAAEKSELEAQQRAEPQLAWTIHPAIRRAYDGLEPDKKAANRAAAQRIPDLLTLIDYVVEPQSVDDDGTWLPQLLAAIQKHLERLAQAEHLGWCAERKAAGWRYHPDRNDELRLHPSLVPWADLSLSDQDKDRSSVLSIPDWLRLAKFKAVPVAMRS